MLVRAKKATVILTSLVISILASVPIATSPSAAAEGSERGGFSNHAVVDDTARRHALDALGKLPLLFEEVRDRTDNRFNFIANAPGIDFGIAPTEAVMRLHGADGSEGLPPAGSSTGCTVDGQRRPVRPPLPRSDARRKTAFVRMQLVRANRRARVVGENQLAAKTNYFIGNDSGRWRTGLANYERVKVKQIYRGVDVVYYGAGQQLEYDFKVAPGANYKAIRLRFSDADRLVVDDSGELVIDTRAGTMRQHKPVAYQLLNGVRRPVSCRYAIQRDTVAFAVGQYDAGLPLVIDPVLSYATLLGETTLAQGIAVDSAGNAYVTGRTGDFGGKFPVTPGAAQEKAAGSADAFVTKFDPKGSRLIYSTYLGGKGSDVATSIAVDRDGNAYITGYTSSSDFPATAGSIQTTKPGDALDKCAFILKLSAGGDAISYATYLCGSDPADPGEVNILGVGMSIAVDSAGSAYVTGYTEAKDFPTKNPLQANNLSGTCSAGNFTHPCADAFVTKLNAAGNGLVYSTYLGGGGIDIGRSIALDSAGNAYVVGDTTSGDFPLMNPLQSSNHSVPCVGDFSSVCDDAFVAKLNAAGSALMYSTYLGGASDDQANGVAVDSAGRAYITGSTTSTDFPITSAVYQQLNASVTLMASQNGGKRFTPASKGLPSNVPVLALAGHPESPSNVYAGTQAGIFKSTDGGESWRSVGAQNIPITAIAFDPERSSNLYATGYVFGSSYLFKSVDTGENWTPLAITANGFSPYQIYALAVDPTNSSILYAAGSNLLKSTNGGAGWSTIETGLALNATVSIYAIALDPTNPSIVYVAIEGIVARSGVYRSTDGGLSWAGRFDGIPNSGANLAAIVIDPGSASTLYATLGHSVFKSTNSGKTWQETALQGAIMSLAIDPRNPATLYAGSQQGLLKTDDGGLTSRVLSNDVVQAIAVNRKGPNALYAGTGARGGDAFVAKLSANGSVLEYSTYVGGESGDKGNAIALDESGNAYVVGQTHSLRWPVANAFQSRIGGENAQAGGDAFVVKLNSSASGLLYSSFIGSIFDERANSVALDASGNVFVAGDTESFDFQTTPGAFQTVGPIGYKAFVIRIGVPKILNITIDGKKLIIHGEGFDSGAVILVDGTQQRTTVDPANPTTVLIATKAGKQIAPGQGVLIQVRNADGTLSNEFAFTRASQ